MYLQFSNKAIDTEPAKSTLDLSKNSKLYNKRATRGKAWLWGDMSSNAQSVERISLVCLLVQLLLETRWLTCSLLKWMICLACK